MSKIKIQCENCGKQFERRKADVNRTIREGRRNYCSLSCCAKHSQLGRPCKNPDFIKQFAGNRKDEYSQFRYHLRKAKERKKKCDLTLEYLKELWDKQNGICPYTGMQLLEYVWNKSKKPNTASLDRIDSSKGYIKGNVRFICLMANYARNKWSDKEVVEFISKAKA